MFMSSVNLDLHIVNIRYYIYIVNPIPSCMIFKALILIDNQKKIKKKSNNCVSAILREIIKYLLAPAS